MNEKINLQELINLLSQKSGITKKDAELFLKECFDTINEALVADQSVKIKNLGSIKLALVSDRESIDVVTGARVLIPAHYKANFSADNTLAQVVNEPFDYFVPVEVNEKDEFILSDEKIVFVEEEEEEELTENQDEIQKEEETLPVVDPGSEIPDNQIDSIDFPKEEVQIVDETIIEDKLELIIENEPITEIKKENFKINLEIIDTIKKELEKEPEEKSNSISIEKPNTIVIENPDNIVLKNPNEIIVKNPDSIVIKNPEEIVTESTEEEKKETENKYFSTDNNSVNKKIKKYLHWLIIPSYFAIMGIVALVFWYLYTHPDIIDRHDVAVPSSKSETISKETLDPIPLLMDESFLLNDTITSILDKYVGKQRNRQDSIKQLISKQEIQTAPEKKDATASQLKTGNAKKVTIKSGETLTRLANEEYGNKCFWVYIYEENKNIIKNPNNIPAGETITIPPAEKYRINKNNPESIKRANEIANKLN
jgi:nucleoid DNA-binding protein